MVSWALYGNARFGGPVFPGGPVPYVGPADAVGLTPVAWFGLRGMNAAVSNGTTKAINLRRDSDNQTQDFVILTSGALDVGSIVSFKGSANLFVTKLYDQTGNVNDVAQPTAANQPKFLLNQFGSSTNLPAIQGVSASSLTLVTQAGVLPAQAQPFVTVAVCDSTSSASTGAAFALGSVGLLGGLNAANTGFMYAGTTFSGTMNNNALHAMLGLFNGASSVLNIDNSETTGNAGASTVPANQSCQVCTDNFADLLNGFVGECGYWASTMNATQRSSLVVNMKSYWSIP